MKKPKKVRLKKRIADFREKYRVQADGERRRRQSERDKATARAKRIRRNHENTNPTIGSPAGALFVF